MLHSHPRDTAKNPSDLEDESGDFPIFPGPGGFRRWESLEKYVSKRRHKKDGNFQNNWRSKSQGLFCLSFN